MQTEVRPALSLPGECLVVALGERRFRVERPWGALPTGAGKVTDVAVDGANRVYVLTRRDHYVDAPRDCVHVLAPDGAHLASWGAERILDAHMLAVDPSGRVWVVDRDCHEIVAFDAEGRELETRGRRHRPLEPFNHPSAVAFTHEGDMIVADGYAGGSLHRFDADGRHLHRWGAVGTAQGEFLTVHGLWVLPDGRIAVADRENHRVQLFTPDGTCDAVWTGFHRPSDIWGDSTGQLYVADGIPTLSLFDGAGQRLGRCRPVLNGAHGIHGDSTGHLFLAEGNPSRITRLVPFS
ncbi:MULTISPECIES: hypothetical protein [unclassified Chelatococcus]|uniref:hypothetical protein n=1 Tax=unclassified Chelatococcus TaxID=2638111 RepID=UPI001BD138B2|nr:MULTISPECIES: hypothetical protein [unclassified Chelatococcus]CAH1654578.1 Peptidase [Hyphomicrobiales bacterium]MBS7742768.1 hypothetical protein [Chelatococcus sp. HY11]MBX3542114.1 hypothetical protein [Chelatococcus sp.]MCO5075671.1 hypothetical protein [Chelatococcus sp.]CAH1694969.1 Peptidase [Hyphomicrobiales bacterium]